MALDRLKRNTCRASSAVFEKRIMLSRDAKVTEGQKARLKCMMCSSFFVKEKTLSTHMMKFHFLLKCPECDEYFNQKAGLRLHQNNHHPVKTDPKNVPTDKDLCHFCGIDVGKGGSMVVHLTEVHDGLKCASCDKWCKGGIGLNTHLKSCKSSQRSDAYKCHICKKSFVKCASLVSHIKTCFKKNYKNGQLVKQPDGCVCKICGKHFVSTSSRAGHLTHCMRSYKCSICSKGYSMQSELDRHIRIFHIGEKPYRCKKCGKRFPHSKLLKVHIEVVHKQNNLNSLTGAKKKMHKCIVCRKVFTQQSFLKMHMKIHTNEKRLKCGICGEKFSNEKTIIEHINVFHVPGGCKGDTGDMEYIVECVDSWDQQGSQHVKHENHNNPKHENVSMVTEPFPGASQPVEDHLQTEGQDELTLNLTLSSSNSINSDYSSLVLSSKADTNNHNHLNSEAASVSEGPMADHHLPQLIDTIAAKETSSQDTLLQAILADIPQNNPSSVSNHLSFIKGTCEKAIIDVTQNLYTSLPSPLPCTRLQAVGGTNIDVGGEQNASLLLSLPYTESGQQSDPASTASVGVAVENDSSLTISNDDAEDEDYYVTVNEYSDEEEGEDEAAEGQITDKTKLESSQHSLKKDEVDVMDVNGDCSTVPEIQGYSLRDQPYITEDDLHGINGENFIKMAQNCEWKGNQIQLDPTNCNKHEQNQKIPLEQQKDMTVSHCNDSSACTCSKEKYVQHICGICQQGFQNVQELKQHKISSHSLKCAQCEQQYSKMMDLLNHYESCTCSRNGR